MTYVSVSICVFSVNLELVVSSIRKPKTLERKLQNDIHGGFYSGFTFDLGQAISASCISSVCCLITAAFLRTMTKIVIDLNIQFLINIYFFSFQAKQCISQCKLFDQSDEQHIDSFPYGWERQVMLLPQFIFNQCCIFISFIVNLSLSGIVSFLSLEILYLTVCQNYIIILQKYLLEG